MSQNVELDYTLSMAPAIGPEGGLAEAELDGQQAAFESAALGVKARVEAGELGFWQLPADLRALERVRGVRASFPAGVRDVLLLGIGGSSLGARALCQALAGPLELSGIAQPEHPRLHFPDNSDPWLLHALLQHLDPQKTAAIVISKSGGTVETAAQMLVVREFFNSALGEGPARARMIAITDPEQGSLRALATAEDWLTLEIPPNVGGRFSVLSPAGLLPASLCDIDLEELLEGAGDMAQRCANPSLRQNPAGLLAVIHVLQHRLRARPLHVLMPYADQLRPFAAWYVQLWAESLGKRIDRSGARVESGPTPIVAVGATDQHAQMQLFMEGPRDKLLTFIEVAQPSADLTIPKSDGAAAYLGGHTLAQLLAAERMGATQALASDGRPSLTLHVPQLDAHAMGQLFFLYEAATAFAGELYDINAFDQPGVELGKRLAFGLLGRRGYEEVGSELRETLTQRPAGYRA